MSSTFLLLPGEPEIHAHSSGALWIPNVRAAVIADAHLGFGWAQRRRGELGPVVDAGTRHKLARVADELGPSQMIFLGDVVHAPRPCAPERDYVESTLRELSTRAHLIAVRGNHDRAFAREFAHLPVETVASWSIPGIFAVHGDALPPQLPEDAKLVIGHLHPALPVLDAAGARRKFPVFLSSPACIVLPAFSPFAGGYDLAEGVPAEFERLSCREQFHVHAVTGTRIVPLGYLEDAVRHLAASRSGRAAEFRFGRAERRRM